MAAIKIKVKPPLKVVRARLKLARKKLSETATPHKEISLMLDKWVQKNFKSEGGKVGKWKPFKAGGRYKRKFNARFTKNVSKGRSVIFDSTAKLLQDTGRLRLSFVPFSNKKSTGIGSDLDYSETHEKGFGVPKRRMLPISSEVRKDIIKIYSKWSSKQIKQARL